MTRSLHQPFIGEQLYSKAIQAILNGFAELGLITLRGPLDYLVIGLVVLVWAVVLRYAWRHRLVERYLRLDFTDPLETDHIQTGG